MENLVRVSSKINHKNIKVVVQPTITHEDSKNLAQKQTITHEEEKVALILSLADGLRYGIGFSEILNSGSNYFASRPQDSTVRLSFQLFHAYQIAAEFQK